MNHNATGRYLIALLCGILLTASGCRKDSHVIETDKVNALTPHLMPVRSIDPYDTLYTDLQPLYGILADKKIVMLGEQSHGDGATFLAKARLIKFLHEKMGFDVLAMESGLFDCEFAGKAIRDGVPARQAIQFSAFDIWTGSQQFRPVIEYIEETRNTERPLMFTGFDMQITGRYGRDSLTPSLHRFLSSFGIGDSGGSFALAFMDTLQKKPRTFSEVADSLRPVFLRSLDTLSRRISAVVTPEAALWIQVLKSIGTLATFVWNVDWKNPDPAVVNLRDRQMADNVLWLSRSRYPDKKIIVWAASTHISRNRHEILNRKNSDTAMIPMGHIVWKEMGDSIYALGFTAFEGRPAVRGRNAWDLAAATPGSIEDILHHTGLSAAWLDFQQLPERHWLNDTARARPYGYSTMVARWPQMMDGLLYIQTMTPSTSEE